MTLNCNFTESATDNWTEANWLKVAKMIQPRNGVIEGDGTSELAVIQNTPAAMNVVVGTGAGWLYGLEFDNTAPITVTVDDADATYPRIDLVVFQVDLVANTWSMTTHKGTAAAVPSAPTPTHSATVYELELAQLTIPATSPSITTGMIANTMKFINSTSIPFIIDGGGKVIATGNKGYQDIPFNCTIKSWEVLPDVTGSIVIDLLVGTYATHPTYTSITASDKPTVTAASKATGSALTGWTTALVAGQKLKCNVDSCTTVTLATLILHVSLATE